MNNPILLSIVMPCYLEEENLRLLLPRLKKEAMALGDPFEILIIDTMQEMDNTRQACESNGVTYIHRSGGNNYGDAVRTGIQRARGKYTLFMDADGSHSPEFIKNLYTHKEEYDVVIASRYTEGGSTDNSWILILMSHITNISYSLILNLHYKDISNSFKLYKTEYLKELTLKCKNFDIVEEILYKIKTKHKDVAVLEIPYSFKQRMFGHTKRNLLLFILTYIVTIFRLRFDL